MAEDDDGDDNSPFWSPGFDFPAYARHPNWARQVGAIRKELSCELWQAWVVLLMFSQANAVAYDMIVSQLPERKPWEPEDE